MSPRRNWDSPTPSFASESAPSARFKGGGGHTRLRVRGWGSPNSDDWRKSLPFYLLYGLYTAVWSTVVQSPCSSEHGLRLYGKISSCYSLGLYLRTLVMAILFH